MGVVNLARVDERLIHGQVMVTLSQKSGVNSIFVVELKKWVDAERSCSKR